jgi:hypothetical protein
MQGKGLVFVTGDRLGDQLTALLEEAGCQVVRGPQPQPPALTVFPREEWPRWFGETDRRGWQRPSPLHFCDEPPDTLQVPCLMVLQRL